MEKNVTNMPAAKNEFPHPEEAFEWPREAMREGNWKEAARRWAVLRKAYPNHPAGWFQGANAYIEAGELDAAEGLLNQARESFPNHPNALLDAAAIAMRRQEWDAAEELLEAARKKHADLPQTWIKSAEFAELRGEVEQALAYSERACQSELENPGPYAQCAELAMRMEKWEEALKRWEKLREKFPEHPAGYRRAAEAARKLGRTKEARELLLVQQYGADILEEPEQKSLPQTRQQRGHARPIHLLELIWTKAVFNLRSEVHRNYLSYGWWVLEPLLHMVIYYIVFGHLLNRGGANFPVFLLTGLIPWMWFMKSVSSSSSSILAGQNLMLQVGLPSIVFPLVTILQASLKQIPVFVLLFGFVWLQGHSPSLYWWALIPVIIVQALITAAFACAVAAVIPFVRDLAYLVPTGLTFLMFLSGIFYDYHTIPQQWQELFLLNPIAFLLKCYREIFMEGMMPNFVTLMWWGLGSAVACLVLMLAYNRLRYIYPRIVME